MNHIQQAAGATGPDVPRPVRIAAHVAALTPLPSAIWRLTPVFGAMGGYTDAGLENLDVEGWSGRTYLIVLSVLTEAAALLTLGLVSRWGEVFPRWIPVVGARPVNRRVVATAAYAGAAVLILMWTPNLLWWWIDHPDLTPTGSTLVGLLYLPLVAWGPLLALVTVSYARRREAPGEQLSA